MLIFIQADIFEYLSESPSPFGTTHVPMKGKLKRRNYLGGVEKHSIIQYMAQTEWAIRMDQLIVALQISMDFNRSFKYCCQIDGLITTYFH